MWEGLKGALQTQPANIMVIFLLNRDFELPISISDQASVM